MFTDTALYRQILSIVKKAGSPKRTDSVTSFPVQNNPICPEINPLVKLRTSLRPAIGELNVFVTAPAPLSKETTTSTYIASVGAV